MNRWNSWQYRPLTEVQQNERDALIRLMLKAAQELARRRLVRCTNFITEQRVDTRYPIKTPGHMPRYREAKLMEPDPAWGLDHAHGAWTVELSVRVDQADRDMEATDEADLGIVMDLLGIKREGKDSPRVPKRQPLVKQEVTPIISIPRRKRPARQGYHQVVMPLAAKPVQLSLC